jgi:uncharacterized protein YdiU (UPF0061 family)
VLSCLIETLTLTNTALTHKVPIRKWFKTAFDVELRRLETTKTAQWQRFKPLNWQMQVAIEAIERHLDYSLLHQLLDIIRRNTTTRDTPFDQRLAPKQQPLISCSS